MANVTGLLLRLTRRLLRQQRPAARRSPGRFAEIASFGSNPGRLELRSYRPADLPAGAPLVVVLHGCGQGAMAYARGAGWKTLADRYGFGLLLPQQRQGNNKARCFNWFLPGHTRRGLGEAESIRQMVEHLAAAEGYDRDRVFVTGLSAGAAMAVTLLAAYPELFAGGAAVAGLPYGAATTLPEALKVMKEARSRSPEDWAALVRQAAPHAGPWPKLSIWHGDADPTVDPANAAELEKQWSALQGLADHQPAEERTDGFPRRVWRDADGDERLESFCISGLAHGTPVSAAGRQPIGRAGPFLLEAGISSSFHIARFWGLVGRERPAPIAPGVKRGFARGLAAGLSQGRRRA